MNDSLGLDHPLIAVHNMAAARQTYSALGFTLSPEGMHPWGTATSLMLFENQILEIVSIRDKQLLDNFPAGSFVFGRHIEYHLAEHEGVSLSALFTDDSDAVEKTLVQRGVPCSGTIDFGRDVVRADGTPDRTKTTLKVFSNKSHPRLSVFACHQHRRDLLEFPHMMQHANGAHGIAAVTVCCSNKQHSEVLDWLMRLHGTEAKSTAEEESTVITSNGFWRVCSLQALERRFGLSELSGSDLQSPSVVGIDIRVEDLAQTERFINNPKAVHHDGSLVLQLYSELGNVLLRFVQSPKISCA